MTALAQSAKGLRVFAADVVDGFFEITHSSLALLGVALVFFVITAIVGWMRRGASRT